MKLNFPFNRISISYILLLFSFQVYSNAIQYNKNHVNGNINFSAKYIIEKKPSNNKTNKSFSHPVDLSIKQIKRILYAIKIKNPGLKVFNSEELNELAPILQKEFKSLKPNEKLTLTRTFINKKTNKNLIDSFSFSFINSNYLHLKYIYSGYNKKRQLEQGNDVYTPYRNGRGYFNELLMKKDLWTKNINKKIFKSDIKIKNIIDNSLIKNNDKVKKNPDLDSLQKEIEKLDNLLEKKIITKEQYNILRNHILKKEK